MVPRKACRKCESSRSGFGDAGDWVRFASVWHDDGWMTATSFQGPAAGFIDASRAGFEPGRAVRLDPAVLAGYPEGYRHLAYLQRQLGHQVMPGLPGLIGTAVEQLYREGAGWVCGSPTTGIPHTTVAAG